MLQLFVVRACDYPINLFPNPNPVYKSLIYMKVLYFSASSIKFQCLYDCYLLSRHIHLSARAHTAIIKCIINYMMQYIPVFCRTGQRFHLQGHFRTWNLSCLLVCHFYSMFRLYKSIVRWIISCNCYTVLLFCNSLF
jgi:hypothetical protein